jgi:hypothetical protein
MSPFMRKTLACLAGVAVGIITGELFFVTLALALSGFDAVATLPFKGFLPLATMFSALAVAPWPMIGTREGYGPLWFSSLVMSVGFGIIGGVMYSFMHGQMNVVELNVLLHGSFAFCAGFFACLTVHLTGAFKQADIAV